MLGLIVKLSSTVMQGRRTLCECHTKFLLSFTQMEDISLFFRKYCLNCFLSIFQNGEFDAFTHFDVPLHPKIKFLSVGLCMSLC